MAGRLGIVPVASGDLAAGSSGGGGASGWKSPQLLVALFEACSFTRLVAVAAVGASITVQDYGSTLLI